MVVTPPSSLLQPSVIITDSYSGVDFDADVYVDLDANFEVVVDVNVDVNADVDVGGLPSQPQPSVTPPPLTCSTLSIFPHVNACSSTSTK